MKYFEDAERSTGSEREIKRAVNDLGARVSALEGETDIEPTGEPAPEDPPEETPEAPEGEIPLEFPHREILGRLDLLKVEDLLAKSVEELIALEELGEARVSDIVEAREEL